MRALLPLFVCTVAMATAVAVAGCSSDESDNNTSPTDTGVVANNNTSNNNGQFIPDTGIEMDMGVEDMDAGFADAEPEDMGFVDMGFPDSGVPLDAGFATDAGFDTTCSPTFFPGGACGGALTGTQWRFVDGCGPVPDIQQVVALCSGIVLLNTSRTVTGTITFQLTDEYSLNLLDTVMATVLVPRSCVELITGSPAGTCAGVQSILTGAGFPISCMTVGGDCNCAFDTVLSLSQPTGAYASAGSIVTLQPSGGNLESWQYCVGNGVMRVQRGTTTYVLTR